MSYRDPVEMMAERGVVISHNKLDRSLRTIRYGLEAFEIARLSQCVTNKPQTQKNISHK
jgi:transposase-like protein